MPTTYKFTKMYVVDAAKQFTCDKPYRIFSNANDVYVIENQDDGLEKKLAARNFRVINISHGEKTAINRDVVIKEDNGAGAFNYYMTRITLESDLRGSLIDNTKSRSGGNSGINVNL